MKLRLKLVVTGAFFIIFLLWFTKADYAGDMSAFLHYITHCITLHLHILHRVSTNAYMT